MNNEKIKKILVTGANGFIGRAVCKRLSHAFRIVAFDRNFSSADTSIPCSSPGTVSQKEFSSGNSPAPDTTSAPVSVPPLQLDLQYVKGDITDHKLIKQLCNTHKFDAVIHCAGIAHQKAWKINAESYENINAKTVRKLAAAASAANSEVYFIFLSSISVYGEQNNENAVKENTECTPTSEYGKSKLNAEHYLIDIFNRNIIQKTDSLRLSPVYDMKNSFNLDKRIFAPGKLAYVIIGKGHQKMSALARANLVDFILYRLNFVFNSNSNSNNASPVFFNTFNVCDKKPYAFKDIIKIFNRSPYQPRRPVIRIPLLFIKMLTTAAGCLMKSRRSWFNAAYRKISRDLVFDNGRMLETGFDPLHDLSSVFIRPDLVEK